jgi:hypothetical protein
MQWIKFTDEKPTKSDFYFVKGKKGMKACIDYYSDEQEWEIGNLPSNYFNDEEIYWLKED